MGQGEDVAAVVELRPAGSDDLEFAGWALAVAEALVAGPAEVVVLDRPDLLAVARLATAPGAVVAVNGRVASTTMNTVKITSSGRRLPQRSVTRPATELPIAPPTP